MIILILILMMVMVMQEREEEEGRMSREEAIEVDDRKPQMEVAFVVVIVTIIVVVVISVFNLIIVCKGWPTREQGGLPEQQHRGAESQSTGGVDHNNDVIVIWIITISDKKHFSSRSDKISDRLIEICDSSTPTLPTY